MNSNDNEFSDDDMDGLVSRAAPFFWLVVALFSAALLIAFIVAVTS